MRVLLKISGETLAGGKGCGLDLEMLNKIANIIKKLKENKVQIGIVVGAGNFIRGAEVEKINIDRCNADNMGMLAININAIALMDVIEKKGIKVKYVNSFGIDGVVEKFNKQTHLKSLEKGKIIIFGGGTGNPFFTTDTSGVLRALEIEADFMIKATKVNGVYDKDPKKNNDAKFIEEITYDEVITKNLKVMDATAIALAKENNMKLKVVNIYDEVSIMKAIKGEKIGTNIH
ncbi:UMP kinase [Candidatus Gracilibacteria bacterium]|nr:MAG: UMP kinase [Candidatus Gracilibacteria bacterium]PIE84872.1 MAG: UMP kinase [Candidatus Gracilibacteria bacterium]